MDDREELLELYRQRVDGYGGPEYRAAWRRWCSRLLVIGGELVVPPLQPDARLEELLAGAFTHTGRVQRRRGEPNSCHANAATLWVAGDAAAIGTGYALADDGLWVQHSWGLRPRGGVLETTVDRAAYVGVVLSGTPALVFAVSNAAGAVEAVLDARNERSRWLFGLVREAHAELSAGG